MIDSDKNSPTFNSYASVEDLKRYARERGIDIPAYYHACRSPNNIDRDQLITFNQIA